MNTFRWPAVKYALLAVVLLATACGASASVDSATNVAPTAPVVDSGASRPVFASPTTTESTNVAPTANGIPAELADFGELISLRSTPLKVVFGPTGGALSLSDGATVTVPPGSFAADTEMSVVVADLVLDAYLQDPPDARIYVLSTVEDVALSQPIVVEVPKTRESVTVTQRVDGEWVPIEASAAPTTLIEITHFSSNEFAVIDRPECPADATRALCEPSMMWGDWYTFYGRYPDGFPDSADTREPLGTTFGTPYQSIDGLAAATLLLPYFEACLGVCPNLASPPGAAQPGTGSTTAPTAAPTTGSSGGGGAAPAPTAVRTTGSTPVPTAKPAPTAAPTPKPAATTTAAACETGYTRHSSGDCRTTGNGCIYPNLDFAGRSGCIFRFDCVPVSAGYTISGNNTCIFKPPASCQSGWAANSSGQCVSPRYGCVHPKLDFPENGSCISPSMCSPQSQGFFIVGSECIHEPPQQTCPDGYSPNSSGQCVTPRYGCAHPNLDYAAEGRCISPSGCSPQSQGYFIIGSECLYEPPVSG